MSVCLSVLYRNPHGWTDLDEIWHGGGLRVRAGSWGGGGGAARYPRPQCRVTQSSIVYSEEDKIYLNYTHRQLGR